MELYMAQKKRVLSAGTVALDGTVYPPEAYDYHGEVSKEAIEKLKEKVGEDFSDDDWETIDGFGRIVQK